MPPVSGGFGERIEEYQVLELLGKGGFAHVYKARCLRSGVFVAIKMIDKGLMESAGMVGRVRQEVTIHSRLKHPAILELYTFFEDIHYVYLVLELAHNGELARHFRLAAGGMSEKAASDVMRQVVDGVLYLHSHQILHRDLSLNNLLITKDLKVKIADFGLATQLSQPDEKHLTMCGTPNYISPEVASRSRHGLPADVWGLGCLLYTLLVGKPPFDTNHVKQTLNRVIHADFQMPRGLSAEGQDLLDRLLRKNPSERISLVQLVRHPFLINSATSDNSCQHGMESSRDSGFHTTLHTTQSTQHNRARSEERMINSANADMLPYQRFNNGENVYDEIKKRPNSINVLAGINNDTSNYTNSHLIEQSKKLPFECLPININNENFHNSHSTSGNNQNRPIEYMESDNIVRGRYNTLTKSNSPVDIKDEDMIECYNKGTDEIQKNASVTASENKENILSAPRSIGVPPLCAARLSEVTHRTRNAELSISQNNSVTINFIKKRGRLREDRITEVCNISKDGMKIIIYSVDGGKGHPLTSPLPTHSPSSQEIFTYHNLPQKHWKKYLYASRFVDLVKAKTPKITLYGSKAKCHLMENGTDFEGNFYDGGKIILSATDGLKIVDSSGNVHSNPKNLQTSVQDMYDNFQECIARCHEVESALQGLSEDCFPLIMGRKPHTHNHPAVICHSGSQQTTPILPIGGSIDIGSFCHNTASASSRNNEDDKHYDPGMIVTQSRSYNAFVECAGLQTHRENPSTLRHPMTTLKNTNNKSENIQQHQNFYDGYREPIYPPRFMNS